MSLFFFITKRFFNFWCIFIVNLHNDLKFDICKRRNGTRHFSWKCINVPPRFYVAFVSLFCTLKNGQYTEIYCQAYVLIFTFATSYQRYHIWTMARKMFFYKISFICYFRCKFTLLPLNSLSEWQSNYYCHNYCPWSDQKRFTKSLNLCCRYSHLTKV